MYCYPVKERDFLSMNIGDIDITPRPARQRPRREVSILRGQEAGRQSGSSQAGQTSDKPSSPRPSVRHRCSSSSFFLPNLDFCSEGRGEGERERDDIIFRVPRGRIVNTALTPTDRPLARGKTLNGVLLLLLSLPTSLSRVPFFAHFPFSGI